jgi:glycosyltransferase involved in cell wall biosynthesis
MSRKNQTVLFYSSVVSVKDFEIQGFYREDIRLLKNLGYNVVCTNSLFDFIYFKYDFCFLYFYKKAAIAAAIARVIRFKKVYFTGGIDDLSDKIEISFFRRIVFKLLFLLCYIFSNKINIVSLSDLNNSVSILDYFRIKSNKILHFPHSYLFLNNQIDCENKSNDFISICWMSTVGNVKRKGLDKALFFFASLSEIFPESKFYIVGSLGKGTEYLMSLSAYEKIKERIIFTGFLDEVKKNSLLCTSRYYVQFSNYEGFGIAALEANLFKCFIFHSGSGGFLNSVDIWGTEVNMGLEFNEDNISRLFKSLSYFEDLNQFNKRYDSFVMKFSSENRMNNLKILLNE